MLVGRALVAVILAIVAPLECNADIVQQVLGSLLRDMPASWSNRIHRSARQAARASHRTCQAVEVPLFVVRRHVGPQRQGNCSHARRWPKCARSFVNHMARRIRKVGRALRRNPSACLRLLLRRLPPQRSAEPVLTALR